MKNRLFVALLLTAVLALPALAQQAAPTTQDQPAAAAGASGKPALQPDTHEGFWGKINPFARKKYVQRQTAPIRDRVNELAAEDASLGDSALRDPCLAQDQFQPRIGRQAT